MILYTEEILEAYGLPKETVCAIIMLCKTHAIDHSPDGDTEFFNIVPWVLQRDTFVPYMFAIYLDYVLRTSIDLIKDHGFTF